MVCCSSKSLSDVASKGPLISRVGPRKASALPLVVEAMESQRPGSKPSLLSYYLHSLQAAPIDISAVPSTGKEPFAATMSRAKPLQNGLGINVLHFNENKENEELVGQISILSTEDQTGL